MRGVNRVILIGNLGKDPEVQHLEGNIAVAKFPLATTETHKDKNGNLVSQTEWHTIEIVGDNLVMLDKRKENEVDLPKDDDNSNFGMGMINDNDISL